MSLPLGDIIPDDTADTTISPISLHIWYPSLLRAGGNGDAEISEIKTLASA